MKVLLINGSPNKNGCTYTALSEIAKTLEGHDIEAEIFWIKTKPIIGCIACGKCAELGKCTFDNDVVNEFVQKAYDAEQAFWDEEDEDWDEEDEEDEEENKDDEDFDEYEEVTEEKN